MSRVWDAQQRLDLSRGWDLRRGWDALWVCVLPMTGIVPGAENCPLLGRAVLPTGSFPSSLEHSAVALGRVGSQAAAVWSHAGGEAGDTNTPSTGLQCPRDQSRAQDRGWDHPTGLRVGVSGGSQLWAQGTQGVHMGAAGFSALEAPPEPLLLTQAWLCPSQG